MQLGAGVTVVVDVLVLVVVNIVDVWVVLAVVVAVVITVVAPVVRISVSVVMLDCSLVPVTLLNVVNVAGEAPVAFVVESLSVTSVVYEVVVIENVEAFVAVVRVSKPLVAVGEVG